MNRFSERLRLAFVLCGFFLVTGCSSMPFFGDDGSNGNKGKPGKSAGQYKVGSPYKINGVTYKPQEFDTFTETGIASWYGPGFHGKSTANGERFDTNELTAAHRVLPMPSLVRVTNLENGRSVVLRVNDRGPFAHNRVIDVSQKGAELLGFKNKGTARVRVQLMERESARLADLAKKGISTRGQELAHNRASGAHAPGLPPVPPAPPIVRQASVQAPMTLDDGSSLPGHVKGGVFYPDPVVRQEAVNPTTLFVQAGSFTQEAAAKSLSTELQAFGAARVYAADVRGTRYFRVRISAKSVPEADRIIAALKRSGYKDSIIVVE